MASQTEYLLSIIIPSYNNEQFIVETLNSLHAAGPTDEVEIIIVNDGSTDTTEEKIKAFYQDRPAHNIKYVYQPNAGVAITRNIGLEYATGSYIGFIDSDDLISPAYFSILLPALRQKKYDIVEFRLTRDINKLERISSVTEIASVKSQEISLIENNNAALAPTFYAAQWHLVSKIFRRDIIGDDRFEANRRYEDMIFSPFQYFKCKNILKIDSYLYYYRINNGGITENLETSDARHIFFAMNKMRQYIQQHHDKKTIGTLMIVNCFLEGRKILRKINGYYSYEDDMVSDIEQARLYCDKRVVKKRVFYKMKYISLDSFVSRMRYHVSRTCKLLLSKKGI